MNPGLIRTLGVIALALLSGCKASRYYDARYLEAPVEVEVRSDSVAGSQVRALVSVLGVARPDETAKRPKQVEIRMRFENLGTVPAQLVEDGLSLVSADLLPFGQAQLQPRDDLSIPAGQTRQFDVAFAAPDKDPDWRGLNLRFTLKFQDVPVTVGASFHRVVYSGYDPYWHVGVGYSAHW